MKNLEILTDHELLQIEGGADGFWYDVAYGIAYAFKKGYWEPVGLYGSIR